MDNIRRGGIKILTISWLLLILVLVSVIGILYLEDSNNDSVMRSLSVKNRLAEMISTIKDAETGQRGFLLDGGEKYLKSYHTAESQADSLIAILTIAVKENPLQKRKLILLRGIVKKKFKEMDETIKLAKNDNQEKAIAIFRSDIGFQIMLEIEQILKEISDEETEVLQRTRAKTERLRWCTIGLVFISIVIIAFGLHNTNSKTIPLMKELSETKTSLDQSMEELKQTNQYLENAVLDTKEEVRMRTKSENEAKFLVKRLKAKNKELNHFAYIASHDLQEPLRTVSNFIALFKEEYQGKLGESANTYFQFIDGATDKMRNLITSLLNYARLGASAEAEEVDLQVLVAEVEMMLVTVIHDTKAKIVVGDLPTLLCYKTELAQILQNLLTNALKFTKPNETPVIEISAEEDESHWEIAVADNGIGISERNQEKIFNIFSKLHSSTEYAGQGIGLAFCKKIVDLHKGEIWVDSEEGKGSTFHFTISKNLLDDEKKIETNTSN